MAGLIIHGKRNATCYYTGISNSSTLNFGVFLAFNGGDKVYMLLFFRMLLMVVETRCELMRFVHYCVTNILEVFPRIFSMWNLSVGTQKELLWESCRTDWVHFVGLTVWAESFLKGGNFIRFLLGSLSVIITSSCSFKCVGVGAHTS